MTALTAPAPRSRVEVLLDAELERDVTPAEWAGKVQLVPTRKISEAQYAHCETCDQWLGCQYWALSKSVALHKRGTGHPVVLYRLAATR